MNQQVIAEYRRLRERGWNGANALSGAKTNVAFAALEEHLVRLDVEPEIDFYDNSFVDTWTHLSAKKREEIKKELHEQVEREGHWILVSYARQNEEDEWEAVDSVGGFIGREWIDSGYDVDVKREALEWIDDRNEESARELEARATYAAPGWASVSQRDALIRAARVILMNWNNGG